MRVRITTLAAATMLGLAGTASAAIFYEPFDYAVGNLGLNTNPSNGQAWYSSLPTPTTATDDRVQVVAGNLSTAGFATVTVYPKVRGSSDGMVEPTKRKPYESSNRSDSVT